MTIHKTILNYLAKTRDGRESVSHLTDLLRGPCPGSRQCYGPHPSFPAGHSEAMDEFRRLGFSVVPGKRRFTWDVTL